MSPIDNSQKTWSELRDLMIDDDFISITNMIYVVKKDVKNERCSWY